MSSSIGSFGVQRLEVDLAEAVQRRPVPELGLERPTRGPRGSRLATLARARAGRADTRRRARPTRCIPRPSCSIEMPVSSWKAREGLDQAVRQHAAEVADHRADAAVARVMRPIELVAAQGRDLRRATSGSRPAEVHRLPRARSRCRRPPRRPPGAGTRRPAPDSSSPALRGRPAAVVDRRQPRLLERPAARTAGRSEVPRRSARARARRRPRGRTAATVIRAPSRRPRYSDRAARCRARARPRRARAGRCRRARGAAVDAELAPRTGRAARSRCDPDARRAAAGGSSKSTGGEAALSSSSSRPRRARAAASSARAAASISQREHPRPARSQLSSGDGSRSPTTGERERREQDRQHVRAPASGTRAAAGHETPRSRSQNSIVTASWKLARAVLGPLVAAGRSSGRQLRRARMLRRGEGSRSVGGRAAAGHGPHDDHAREARTRSPLEHASEHAAHDRPRRRHAAGRARAMSVMKPGVSRNAPPRMIRTPSITSRWGILPGRERLLEAQPCAPPCQRQQARADDRVGDQEQDRPQRADRLADLDDHVDLRDRHDDEEQDEQEASIQKPRRRRAGRPSGPPGVSLESGP